jgi:hypothetical protein
MTDQDDVDELFGWIVECDRSLDDVIVNLRAAGVKVEPEQRVIVSRWLDLFSADSPIPMGARLSMLRGMLRA